jgi:hypothetical protein
MREKAFAWRAYILLLCLPLLGSAQTGVQEKAAAAESGEARLNQVGTQEELDDYLKMHNEADPDVKRELIEQFIRRYSESGLLAYVYQDGFYLGRRANDLKVMTLYGEKSLQLWPGNYTLLTELAGAYVQRDLLEEAEAKASAALRLLDRAARPSNIPEQRPIDDFTFYGLGFTGMLLNDYAMAESNLAKAVAVDGILMPNARFLLEDLYKSQHKQSLAGLEEIIAKARKEIGLYQEAAIF